MDWDEFFGLDDGSPFMMLIWILPIAFFVLYGQRIQLYISSSDIKKSIAKLSKYADGSRDELLQYLGARKEPGRIDAFLDYFTIMPTDLDPAGIVPKIRHTVRSREDHTRRQLKSTYADLDEYELAKVQTLLEIATSLRLLYRVVNHLYLTAKKQKNYPLIVPLQMMLPFIMEEAESLSGAMSAFKLGQPVGDSIGPMVVGRMMLETEKRPAAFQTVYSETEYDGRTMYLVKAQGPAPSVGRLGDAVEMILSKNEIDAIIMVDAALKFEGEDSAAVSRGFGAAIGGIGTEKFQIEQAASERNIPVFAIIIKESVKEAVTVMTQDIADRADDIGTQVHDTIKQNTEPGQSVMVLGVGNTVGVQQ